MAKPDRAKATAPKLSILTKKKDRIKLKSEAFRSKLNVAHAERTKKRTHARRDSKGKRRKKHALDFASFERTLEGLGKQYGGDANALRMKGVTVTGSKQRERVVKEERGRMEAVLHHPVFKEDPPIPWATNFPIRSRWRGRRMTSIYQIDRRVAVRG